MQQGDESNLMQQCFTWHWNSFPDQRGLLFMIHNTPRNAIDGARLKGMGMVAGVADMCYLGSVPVFIEFKLPDGKQSDKQCWWQGVIQQAGYRYEIIRNFNQFKTLIYGSR